MKLSKLTTKEVRAFESKLRAEGRSEAMVRKVLTSLSSMLSDAQERGNTAKPVRDMRSRRKAGKSAAREKRRKGKLTVGVDIPLPDEVRQSSRAPRQAAGEPCCMTAAFTGLRASELRGLRWEHVDLDEGEIARRRARRPIQPIGAPKTRRAGGACRSRRCS